MAPFCQDNPRCCFRSPAGGIFAYSLALVERRTRVAELQTEKAAIASRGFEEAIRLTGLNKAAVMVTLWENVQGAMAGEPIVNRDGVEIGRRYDRNAANRGLKLLGKELGMFTERIETTLKLEDRIRAMSDEERLAYSTELLESVRSIAGPPGPDEEPVRQSRSRLNGGEGAALTTVGPGCFGTDSALALFFWFQVEPTITRFPTCCGRVARIADRRSLLPSGRSLKLGDHA
jgi:hypothetical protein